MRSRRLSTFKVVRSLDASDTRAPIERLALSFPALRDAPGISPWDAERLDAWACQAVTGAAARHAARFLLSVWDSSAEWRCGRFNGMEAVRVWDAPHRGAFLTWVVRPWWR